MSIQLLSNLLTERSSSAYNISIHHGLLAICLSYSQLDDDETIKLFECLENIPNINSLEIRSNSIADKGAIAIADFIEKDKACQYLDLSFNNIGSKGSSAIFNSLEKNKFIKVILENNPIPASIKKLFKENNRFLVN